MNLVIPILSNDKAQECDNINNFRSRKFPIAHEGSISLYRSTRIPAKEPGRMREMKPEKARPFTAVLVC